MIEESRKVSYLREKVQETDEAGTAGSCVLATLNK